MGGQLLTGEIYAVPTAKGCIEDTDRHGNICIYIARRTAEDSSALVPWTPEFMQQYEVA
jgi:hypothetical protein